MDTDMDAQREKMFGDMVISAADAGGLESLEVLVDTVETGLEEIKRSYIAVGQALKEIRDQKLYRQSHKTFEAFVHARFGLSRSSAYNYINAAAIVQRAGHGAPAPSSIRAVLAKKKKAVTLEAPKPELAPGLPHRALLAPPNDPLTEDERWVLELREGMRKGLERVPQNRKADIFVRGAAEEMWIQIPSREPITIVPQRPTIDLSGRRSE